MAELTADTSSYNLPVRSLADNVNDIQGMQQKAQQIQSGALTIDNQKLELANKGLTYLTRAMTSLGPDAPKEAYKAVGANAVKMGLVPPQQLQVWNERVDAAPSSKAFYNEAVTAAANHQEMINYHLGQPGSIDTGNAVQPVVQSPKFGVQSTGLPIAKQPGPGQVEYGANGQPRYRGAAPAEAAPGQVTAPPPRADLPLPVARPQVSGPTGPTQDVTPTTPTSFDNRFAGAFPRGAAAGPAPMFEEGKKNLNEAQLRASTLMQNTKPAIQALKIMKTTYGPEGKSLATGPGTEQFNNLVALAKAWGVTNTAANNDPTVMRQELEKKLAQFVGSSPVGQRSDAAQTLAEAGSPNPKKQILPALISLTQDAVALNRVEAAKALSFKGDDLSKVNEHFAKFPQSTDERAFKLDFMEPKERDDLIKKMATQYKNGDASQKKNAEKFLNSLKLSKELGFYDE